MAGFDPNMVNQALAAQGYGYRVPTLEDAQSNAAQFPSLPQAGAETSMLEQAASAQSLPAWSPGQVSPAFSMVPPPEQQVVMPTEQVAAPAAAPAAMEPAQEPRYTPEEIQMLLARQRQQGGGGGANPINKMLADASERAKTAETEAKGYEAAGDQAVAEAQQAEADLGQVRADAATQIADVQQRMAAEAQPHLEKLAELQDNYVKAAGKVEDEQRQISQFISDYQPKDRRTGMQRAMGALAVGLGQMTDQNNLVAGLMQGMNVQTNNADSTSALIQRGIDRDLEMQRAMLDNKRTALAAKNTELGQIRERFGDQVDTLKLARAVKLDQAIQEMEAIKSRGLAGEQLAVADRAIANLSLDRDNLMMTLKQQSFERYKAQEDQLTLAKWRQSQAPRALTPMQQAELEGKRLDNDKKRQELAGNNGLPPSLVPIGENKPSDDAVKEATRSVARAEGFRAALSELNAYSATPSPTKRRSAELALSAVKSQFNTVLGDESAPNEAQLEMLGEAIANPSEYNLADASEVIKSLDNLTVAVTRGRTKGYGFDYQPSPTVRRGAAK